MARTLRVAFTTPVFRSLLVAKRNKEEELMLSTSRLPRRLASGSNDAARLADEVIE
jgi:hypothetical protein